MSELWGWMPDFVRGWLPINLNRDMNRTPMQWTGGDNAGFCPPNVRAWLPVNAGNKHERNVERQRADPASLLNLYRALLAARRELPALHAGSLTVLDGLPACVLGYLRQQAGQRVAVLLNFGRHAAAFPFDETGDVLVTTSPEAHLDDRSATLPGKAGLVALLA